MVDKVKTLFIALMAGTFAAVAAHVYLLEPRLTWEQAVANGLELALGAKSRDSALEFAKFWLIPALIVFIGTIGLLLRRQTPHTVNSLTVCHSCKTRYSLRRGYNCPKCGASHA